MAELQDWFYKHLSIIEVTALFPEKLSSGVLGLRSRAHLDVLNTLYSQQWLIPNMAYKWLSSILTPAIPNQVKNRSLHTRTYTTSQKYSAHLSKNLMRTDRDAIAQKDLGAVTLFCILTFSSSSSVSSRCHWQHSTWTVLKSSLKFLRRTVYTSSTSKNAMSPLSTGHWQQ